MKHSAINEFKATQPKAVTKKEIAFTAAVAFALIVFCMVKAVSLI